MENIDRGLQPNDNLKTTGEMVTLLADFIHARNVKAGWWTDLKTGEDLHGKRNIGELLALVHSEITEAVEASDTTLLSVVVVRDLLEACELALAYETMTRDNLLKMHRSVSRALEGYRKAAADTKLPHRPAFRVELIDALIRILDTLGSAENDTHPAGEIFVEKVEFNRTRADHQPENRIKPGGKSF